MEPARDERRRPSVIVSQWEHDTRPEWVRHLSNAWVRVVSNYRLYAIVAFAFTLGFGISSGPESVMANYELRRQMKDAHYSLTAREGELVLTRLELGRLNSVMDNSKRYHIPADLAAKIYDIALAEGIEPRVAFSLVDVESDFAHKAISPVGALGLTQLMPSTAKFFDPGINRADLFDPDTNLRIGFRFLKELIAKYDGNVDKALTAYNRGPATVDRVVDAQKDPSNGYSAAVLGGAQ